jgi:hypothetical protein
MELMSWVGRDQSESYDPHGLLSVISTVRKGNEPSGNDLKPSEQGVCLRVRTAAEGPDDGHGDRSTDHDPE